MDSSTVEHSDSDSGESWTLLDNSPTYGAELPDSETKVTPGEREHLDLHSDKDEDTDGISIISDSEPESSPCDYVTIPPEEIPLEQEETALLLGTPLDNNQSNEATIEETDFLGDNVKYKTYVHKRNPKVGSILDIIMLGTFVITAGMALGHLWSCKNECTTQTSVNKILSNLYKLQEENALLRSKLKEITEATTYQLVQQRKYNNKSSKQNRCKKIFEEPILKNDNLQRAIKCVEDNKPEVHDSLAIPEYEKEFLNDVGKMKHIYEQNKDWLDKEVKKQFEDYEKSKIDNKPNSQLDFENVLGPVLSFQPNTVRDMASDLKKNIKTHKQINLEKQLGSTYYQKPIKPGTQDNMKSDTEASATTNSDLDFNSSDGAISHKRKKAKSLPGKKITYADSLKIDQPLVRIKRSKNYEIPNRLMKAHVGKKKQKDNDILLNLDTFSEEDIKKDDRYTGPKQKYDKKKHDRQKSHKRQKRNNKYEQWEMKGGYLKDFDEFSVTSSLDNISINKPEKRFLNADFQNYVNKLMDAENNASNKDLPKISENIDERSNRSEKRVSKNEKRKTGRTKDIDWYDQRGALRAEARSKLEQELFGQNTSNNAAWYFRRMHKREQCRAKKDNSTFKKFPKSKMNFKMKR